MTNIEKIRGWVVEQKEKELLKPGDRLPGYKQMMETFGISYLTVANSLNKLAAEGLVVCKRGSGTYLAGADTLTVLINIHPTSISFARMRKLLNKHLANLDLHLELEFAPADEINNPMKRDEAARKYKAAISVHPLSHSEQELPAVALTPLAGYHEVISNLTRVDDGSYDYALPFTFYSYQLGVNRDLLARIGIKPAQLTPGFGWWDEFVARCRRNRLLPATFDYVETSAMFFSNFQQLLCSLMPYDKEKYEGDEPLFDTPEGHLFLDIIRDTEPITDMFDDPHSFFHNGAVLHPQLGSWITVQNNQSDHPDKEVSDLALVPYRTANGHKLCFLDPDCLKAYLRDDATADERNRVWELMKLMVSREFQMEYCGVTGQISANRGILPTEHYWNRTNQWVDYFPEPGDTIVYGRNRFSPSRRAMFSVLLENYKFFGAEASETLRRMDRKKHFFRIKP